MKTIIPYAIQLQKQLSWAIDMEKRISATTKSLISFYPFLVLEDFDDIDAQVVFDSLEDALIVESDIDITKKPTESNEKKEWVRSWLEKVLAAKISTKNKKRYFFLFAVKIRYGEITHESVDDLWNFYDYQIDKILDSGKSFQRMAEGRDPDLEEKDDIEWEEKDDKIVSTKKAVADMLGCELDSLLKNFYRERKDEFEFQKFPKFLFGKKRKLPKAAE